MASTCVSMMRTSRPSRILLDRAQQPGAALQHNSTSNCSVAAASHSIHAVHCAGSIWCACQEIAYLQHYDLMSAHYHANGATAEMFETAACNHQTQCCMYEPKIQHLTQMELDMYNTLPGPTTYNALVHMDMQCSIELQSNGSEPSENNIMPVPTKLMAARLRIVKWQRRIHAVLACLEPRDHSDLPLQSASNTNIVDNVAMATDATVSTELRHISLLADPTDTLALFRAIGPLDPEYKPLTCHHTEQLIHCVMMCANRHISHPFLMCPFARSPSDWCTRFCWTNMPILGQGLQAPTDFDPSAHDYTLLLCPAVPDKHLSSTSSWCLNTLKVTTTVTAGCAAFRACPSHLHTACTAHNVHPAHGLPHTGNVGRLTLLLCAHARDTCHPRLSLPQTHTHTPRPVKCMLLCIGKHEYPLWTVSLD